MENRILVLDTKRNPLMPCHPARARALLREGKAAVFRRFPFTIILKNRDGGATQPTQVKLDPGSKTTGITLVAEFKRRCSLSTNRRVVNNAVDNGNVVIWAGELEHRGAAIRKALEQRRGHRRFRRSKLRYRQPRFNNRTKPNGWLAPSLQHRVDTTMSWVTRLCRLAPVTALSQELVKFDLQQMQNPEISGIEYQYGELQGYEVREYLLAKWGRKCAYCGAENTPYEIDHIHPRSKGGSNRVSNLTLACHDCNQKKGNRLVSEFLANQPDRLRRILAQSKAPLRDAAAINSTRQALYQRLKATGLPVETGSGGRTKYNRILQQYPKAHWIDSACVGESGESVRLNAEHKPLLIRAMGHGERQRARLNKYGFPVGHKAVDKSAYGFQTGDMVRAVIPKGKFKGAYCGRIAIRARPSFALSTKTLDKPYPLRFSSLAVGLFDVHPKYLTLLHRNDGYAYQ